MTNMGRTRGEKRGLAYIVDEGQSVGSQIREAGRVSVVNDTTTTGEYQRGWVGRAGRDGRFLSLFPLSLKFNSALLGRLL